MRNRINRKISAPVYWSLAMVLCLLSSVHCPLSALAAGAYYYTKPDAATLPDNGRILMYDPNTASDKNITGSTLKQQVAPSQQTILDSIGAPSATPLRKQAPVGASPYSRQVEIKDSITGKIVTYITANGAIRIGTPRSLAITGVWPTNGATGVAITAYPYVTFNKDVSLDITQMYIVGDASAPYAPAENTAWYIWAPNLLPNTTYTIVVKRQLITQTDGETASSCGDAMTDVAGVCQSTFTTAP